MGRKQYRICGGQRIPPSIASDSAGHILQRTRPLCRFMDEKEALHSKLSAYVPAPPLGKIIPDVERLVEIGDASSIAPIRKLLSNIGEALWDGYGSEEYDIQTGLTATDFDISHWDRMDITNRIHGLLESLIFRIAESEAGESRGGNHAPTEAPPGAAPVHMSDFQFEIIGRRVPGGLIRRKESDRLRVWATEFDDAYGSQIEDFFSKGDTVSYAVTAYMVREDSQEDATDSYRLVMSFDDYQGNDLEFHKYVWSEDVEGKLIYNSFELINGFLWAKAGESDRYWFLSMR